MLFKIKILIILTGEAKSNVKLTLPKLQGNIVSLNWLRQVTLGNHSEQYKLVILLAITILKEYWLKLPKYPLIKVELTDIC